MSSRKKTTLWLVTTDYGKKLHVYNQEIDATFCGRPVDRYLTKHKSLHELLYHESRLCQKCLGLIIRKMEHPEIHY